MTIEIGLCDKVAEGMDENGSFYIFKSAEFLKENNRLFGKIGLYPMHNPGP